MDCAGYTFDNTTTINNVTIDGQYHRITNVNLGTSGLVNTMNSSTIKNLWLASGNNNSAPYFYGGSFANQMNSSSSLINVKSSLYLNCSGLCGGLVAAAHDSSITKSVFDGTLDGGAYSGGLVGSDLFDETNYVQITKSAFLGTLISPSYAGGIIGSYANNVQIENSYVNGTFDVGAYSGGMIGAFNDEIYISKSYTDGSGIFGTYSGGMIGGFNSNITVVHSYSLLFAQGNNIGNVEGLDNTNVAYSNVKYSKELGFGECTASTNPSGCSEFSSYFEVDNFATINGFDLTNTWQQEIGEQPTLVVPDFSELADIPNGGDMNDDGIQDTFQGNVEVLKNATDNNWTAIETKDSNSCTLGEADLLNTSDIPKHAGYNILSDYVSFNVYCLDAGQSFTTNIYLDRNIDISNVKLLFYNPANNSYTPIIGATFTHKTIGGQTFTVLSYTLTDGGPYDRDGVANGKIEDPVVLANPTALANVKAPNTGLHKSSSSNRAYVSVLTLALIAVAIKRRRFIY